MVMSKRRFVEKTKAKLNSLNNDTPSKLDPLVYLESQLTIVDLKSKLEKFLEWNSEIYSEQTLQVFLNFLKDRTKDIAWTKASKEEQNDVSTDADKACQHLAELIATAVGMATGKPMMATNYLTPAVNPIFLAEKDQSRLLNRVFGDLQKHAEFYHIFLQLPKSVWLSYCKHLKIDNIIRLFEEKHLVMDDLKDENLKNNLINILCNGKNDLTLPVFLKLPKVIWFSYCKQLPIKNILALFSGQHLMVEDLKDEELRNVIVGAFMKEADYSSLLPKLPKEAQLVIADQLDGRHIIQLIKDKKMTIADLTVERLKVITDKLNTREELIALLTAIPKTEWQNVCERIDPENFTRLLTNKKYSFSEITQNGLKDVFSAGFLNEDLLNKNDLHNRAVLFCCYELYYKKRNPEGEYTSYSGLLFGDSKTAKITAVKKIQAYLTSDAELSLLNAKLTDNQNELFQYASALLKGNLSLLTGYAIQQLNKKEEVGTEMVIALKKAC